MNTKALIDFLIFLLLMQLTNKINANRIAIRLKMKTTGVYWEEFKHGTLLPVNEPLVDVR